MLHNCIRAEPKDHLATPCLQMGKRDYLLMRQEETVVIDESHRFTLQRLEPSDPTRLHVHYMATSDGGPPWLLKMVRPLSRALRSESLSIETEAVLARWLSGTQPSSPSHGILHSHEVMQNDVSVNHRPHTHHVSIPQGFLPEFVRREYISSPHRVECLLTRPVQGILVSSLTEPLEKEHREVVDLQVGGLIREISMHRSPHGLFGRALAVLEAASNRDNARVQHHKRLLVMSETHHCWSDAFTSLLEAVLRDAEDASIAVPYDKIRHHVRRLKHVLDEVKTPNLVILDAGHDSNTVVVWPGTENVQRNQAFVQGPASDAGPSSARQKGANPNSHGVVDACTNATSARNAAIAKSRAKPAPKVIGVRDWHNSVFGDPEFTSVLCSDKGAGIRAGMLTHRKHMQQSAASEHERTPRGVCHAQPRRLLYQCYHLIATIATEYCRAGAGEEDREMLARKRLLQVLIELDQLDT